MCKYDFVIYDTLYDSVERYDENVLRMFENIDSKIENHTQCMSVKMLSFYVGFVRDSLCVNMILESMTLSMTL